MGSSLFSGKTGIIAIGSLLVATSLSTPSQAQERHGYPAPTIEIHLEALSALKPQMAYLEPKPWVGNNMPQPQAPMASTEQILKPQAGYTPSAPPTPVTSQKTVAKPGMAIAVQNEPDGAAKKPEVKPQAAKQVEAKKPEAKPVEKQVAKVAPQTEEKPAAPKAVEKVSVKKPELPPVVDSKPKQVAANAAVGAAGSGDIAIAPPVIPLAPPTSRAALAPPPPPPAPKKEKSNETLLSSMKSLVGVEEKEKLSASGKKAVQPPAPPLAPPPLEIAMEDDALPAAPMLPDAVPTPPQKTAPADIPEAEMIPPPALPPFDNELNEKELASLPAPPMPAPPMATKVPKLVAPGNPSPLAFEPGETALTDAMKPRLSQIAQTLKQSPNTRISLVAHASDTDEKNKKANRISLARALSVRAFLIDQGIDNLRINVEAKGDKEPGNNPDRVEFSLLSPIEG